MKDSVIFLIGSRGSGKTTVARLLAQRLKWSWADADAVLEERCGKTIRAMFAEDGEEAFRAWESKILAELGQTNNLVVATGGGVILRAENRSCLRRGFVVWLTAPAEVLYARMQGDATTHDRRPPLAQGGLAEVTEILQHRQPFYQECAHLVVDTTEAAPEVVVECILQELASAVARLE